MERLSDFVHSIFFWSSMECPCLDTFKTSEEKFSLRGISLDALMKESVFPAFCRNWNLQAEMQWDKNAFSKLVLGCNGCPRSLAAISVWCSSAEGTFLPVCPRALHTPPDVYSSFSSWRIKSKVQRFPKLTLPFIAALGSVQDPCRAWEQKQLMLNRAYPSFWAQSSIYMSETRVAYGGADLQAAPWAGAGTGALNPPLSCSQVLVELSQPWFCHE